MIPDGDRRHYPESGGVVDQPKAAGIGNEDVVAEFVLSHHPGGRKGRPVRDQPVDGMFDGAVRGQSRGDSVEIIRSKPRAVLDGEWRAQ